VSDGDLILKRRKDYDAWIFKGEGGGGKVTENYRGVAVVAMKLRMMVRKGGEGKLQGIGVVAATIWEKETCRKCEGFTLLPDDGRGRG